MKATSPPGEKISVIIPTYCRGDELESLLFPSLLKQSVSPAEVIVVDDTPDDSVSLVCEKNRSLFANSNIDLLYLRNPLRRSATLARNYGVSKASGDLFAFFDSDLKLDEKYLKNILDIFSADPETVGVQGHVINAKGNQKIQGVLKFTRNLESLPYSLMSTFLRNFAAFTMPSINSCRIFEYPLVLDRAITCDWLIGSNFVVKRTVFDLIEFDRTLKGYALGDDILFSIKLKPLGKLYITPYAQCMHFESPSGRIDKAELSWKEKYYLNRIFGTKGTAMYYNKRILFGLLKPLNLIS